MQRTRLRNTSIETTALGFGCGSLTGAGSAHDSLRLLDAAYDAGIRHFDTAPLYGYGAAEQLLGQFAQNKRDQITITTKYGIKVAAGMARRQGLMNAARRIAKAFPLVKKILRRSASGTVSAAAFTPQDAQASLEQSLRQLKTDYVDLFLLHEATRDTAAREDLIAWLQQKIAAGMIRAAGIGSEFALLGTDAAAFDPVYAVFQFQSNLQSPNVASFHNTGPRALITHGTLRPIATLEQNLQRHPAEAARLRDILQTDPIASLPALLLQLALHENPEGLVLFATSRRERLAGNLGPLNKALSEAQILAALSCITAR